MPILSVRSGETGLGGHEAWGHPLSAFRPPPPRRRSDSSEGRTAGLAPLENASLVAVRAPGGYHGVSFRKLLCSLGLSGSTDPILLTESHCFSYFGFETGKSHDRIRSVRPKSLKQLRAFECDRCTCYLRTILVHERWGEIITWTPTKRRTWILR